MIEESIEQFRMNIQSVRELHFIADTIEGQGSSISTSEILRAEIVLAVSALDCFLHDLVRLGTLEIYAGDRPFNRATTIKPRFEVSKLIYLLTRSKDDQLLQLDAEFRSIFSQKTFQDPAIIQDNLRSINLVNIWQDVSNTIGMHKSDIEQKLGLIVSRRHAIAHEADINHQGATGEKNPIDKADVLTDVEFIENVCEAIYRIAENART